LFKTGRSTCARRSRRSIPKTTTGRRNVSGKPERLSKGHWQNLVSQARIVKRETPENAIRVRDGFPLNEAYEIARNVKIAPTTEEKLRERLIL
jgi:hypothetical protein